MSAWEQPAMFGGDLEQRPAASGRRKRWGGHDSRAARAIVAAMLPAPCWRCGRMLTLADKWTAGHLEDRADGGGDHAGNLAPECGRCNYSAGGKRGAAITNGRHAEAAGHIERVGRIKWW